MAINQSTGLFMSQLTKQYETTKITINKKLVVEIFYSGLWIVEPKGSRRLQKTKPLFNASAVMLI